MKCVCFVQETRREGSWKEKLLLLEVGEICDDDDVGRDDVMIERHVDTTL